MHGYRVPLSKLKLHPPRRQGRHPISGSFSAPGSSRARSLLRVWSRAALEERWQMFSQRWFRHHRTGHGYDDRDELFVQIPGRKSKWWIKFRKAHQNVIPAKLALASASRNSGNLVSGFRGKDERGAFRTNKVRTLRKAPDISPEKFTCSRQKSGNFVWVKNQTRVPDDNLRRSILFLSPRRACNVPSFGATLPG